MGFLEHLRHAEQQALAADAFQMNEQWQDIFRQHCCPLEPIVSGESALLRPLREIRAVLFDAYGTLVISASGDVGTAERLARDEAFDAALDACGIAPASKAGKQGVEVWLSAVADHQQAARRRGIDFPEVDVIRVWRETVERLVAEQILPPSALQIDLGTLAAEYEARVNPAWPMPGAQPLLNQLTHRGRLLGIISNAQAYTLAMMPALFGQSFSELGFDEQLQYFSYRLGRAKPGTTMYELAQATLAERGVPPRQVLYVGNDMLNDIWPASRVGFRTALFAGDARSLRRREDDQRVQDLQPDLVLTELGQLAACVLAEDS